MKKIVNLLCILLALVLCVSALPAVDAVAEGVEGEEGEIKVNDVLTVQTRSNTYKFNIGDEFTYSFWLHLVPDVANYAISYLDGYKEYSDALADSKMEWIQGYVQFDDDYLTLESCSLPELESNDNICKKVSVSDSTATKLLLSTLGMTSAVFFDCDTFFEGEETQFNNENTVLVTCTFKVRATQSEDEEPTRVRTKLKQLKIQNDELITTDNPNGTFLVIDDGNPRVAFESYETVVCTGKGINEEPTIVLKSLVDDIGMDVRIELANQILGGEEATMRPGAGVKVTMFGASSDVRGYRQVSETNGESVVWFYDMPAGLYYVKCYFVSDTGVRYATKDVAHAEVVAVPDTGGVQALWLFIEDDNKFMDIPVNLHWVGDEAYLPIRASDMVIRLVDTAYMSYTEQAIYVDTDEDAEDQYNFEYSFDYVPIYELNDDGEYALDHEEKKVKIHYDLAILNLPGTDLYTYSIIRNENEETGALSFDVTFTYIGSPAKLNKIERTEDGHYWEEKAGNKAATCTTPERTYYVCAACHITKYVKGEDALGHLWVTDENDTSEGWKIVQNQGCETDEVQQRKCLRKGCGLVEEKTTGKKLGHIFLDKSEYTPNNDATCTEAGTMSCKCQREGCTEVDTVENPNDPAKGHDYDNKDYVWEIVSNEDHENDRVVKGTCHCGAVDEHKVPDTALGHDYTWTEIQSATCTADAVERGVCDCGATTTRNREGSALGHKYINYVSDGNATCLKDGTKTAKCANPDCNSKKTVTDVDSHTLVEHTYGDFVSNNDATQTDDGTKTRTCTVCQHKDTQADEGTALHHVYSSYVYNEDATCLQNGTMTAHCDEPGCTAQRTVPAANTATGHNMSEYVENNDFTCTEDGTKTSHCLNPNCTVTKTIAANGTARHIMSEPYVKQSPTCTVDGIERCQCTRCTYYTEKAIDATGHKWSEWSEKSKPSCDVDGEKVRFCTVSGCTGRQTEAIEATGHNFVDGVCTKCEAEDPDFTGYRVTFTANQLQGGNEVYIDGVKYYANSSNVVTLTSANCKIATVYTYNSTDSDPHKVYPNHVYVYSMRLNSYKKTYTLTQLSGLTDVLQYAGSSIRLVGTKGIRMITSVPSSTRSSLISTSVNGYSLREYGTLVGYDSKIGDGSVAIGAKSVAKAAAYVKGSKDPIYKKTNSLIQYTNVLVDITDDKCSADLSMRPYMILEDGAGNEIVVYGGIIHRSIGYIAYQNRNAFAAKTSEYEYIWGIIHAVYGTTYDSEYKG